ncbi:MAG: hypothetical protein QE278_08170 [Limnobacter sp.]|nr:hypothetical protein [Limnobacter sp.]
MAQFDPESPPALFTPPMDLAHDIYALGTQIKGFDHATYQDIQHDQVVYDSFQRWPYLFSLVMTDEE